MKKQKGFILGVALILCLLLFACKQSDNMVAPGDSTNHKPDDSLAQIEKSETQETGNNSDIIGAWKSLETEGVFYVFNEDNTLYEIFLLTNEGLTAKVEWINTFSYDIQGDVCKATYSQDYTEEISFSRSENQLTFGQTELELINNIDGYSLVGTWKPANGAELYVHIGDTTYISDSITFYNDGTFKLSGNTGGPYSVVYDGAAVHLDTGGYDSEETISIQMLGCGMMVIGETGSQELLLKSTS